MKHTHRLKPLQEVFRPEPEFDLASLGVVINVIETAPGELDGYRTTATMRLGIDEEPQPVKQGKNGAPFSENVSEKKASRSQKKK